MKSKLLQRKHRRYRVALHRTGWQLGLALVLVFYAVRAPAFSLLGPFAPWMQETNGLRQPGDIGGPMDIGSGYRWNVPIVTYGFDRSFLDYFGKDGVAAVEHAIQIFNDLPAASDMVLTNYPLDTENLNFQAQVQSLYDLKSATLVALLEQMGLTQPTRYMFVLRQWAPFFIYDAAQFSWPSGTIPNYIVMRNFDPETLAPSQYVNGAFYTGYVYSGLPDYYFDGEKINTAFAIPVDPLTANASAVADNSINNLLFISPGILNPGEFFTGLTRDDVGGLRYLLSPENINYETWLRLVHPIGRGLYDERGHRFVRGAWRPGIDKVTFVPQPVNSGNGRFLPTSYRFKDIYIKNNTIRWQEVERDVIRPDILFCAADTGENRPYTSWVLRTDTSHWLNNAVLNDNTNGEGPGVIQGPIKITFHKLGPVVETGYGHYQTTYQRSSWGSFNGSTNLPIVYPSVTYSDHTGFTIRLRFFDTDYSPAVVQITNITWHLPIPIGGQASLQVSTNQADWYSVATVTNVGSVTEWYHYASDNPPMYFRAVPQSQ